MSTLKEKKERFVAELLGGSISEIYYVTSIALSAYLSFNLIISYTSYQITFPLDFILNCITILLALTSYSSQPKYLHIIVIAPGLAVSIANVFKKKTRSKAKTVPRSGSTNKELLVRKPFITAYRAHMLTITNLAILAVDFPIFPRRFAKVETWGTSMMDLGVGSFVFSMGLASSRAIIKQRFNQSDSNYAFQFSQYLQLIIRNVGKAIPVLALGLIRLVSVKSLEYQEHVTEYGIHWNFFISLGLLPIFLALLDPILNKVPRVLVAFAIGIGYEILLMKTNLLKFILRSDNRLDNLITMNKEGICSFIGYLSIFLFGQSFGSFVLTSFPTPNNLISMSSYPTYKKYLKRKNWFTVSTTRGLIVVSLFYQLVFWLVRESLYFSNISRRLANFPYILWVVSYNSALLLGYNIIETYFDKDKVASKLLMAINNNGLFNFLSANLLTGLINMTINTLECPNVVAFGILTAYALILCLLAVTLDNHGIYIKI